MTLRRCVLPILMTLASAPCLADSAAAPEATTYYFISDLHLGVGHDVASFEWSPLEDFRWHNDLVAFLSHIGVETKNHAQLIIVGDFLELWQSVPAATASTGVESYAGGDCVGAGPENGCSELEMNVRVDRVIREHLPTLVALGQFASRGSNRLTIVPGNHDAGLLMPSVATKVLAAIGGGAGRVELTTQGYWLSPDGRILAEHGHQFDRVNSFRSWPKPFKGTQTELRMERPWGEYMVQQFYNKYEKKFPAIDNLNSEADGVRYALSALQTAGVVSGTGEFLKFLVLETSLGQKVDFLGEPEEGTTPRWDVAKVRPDVDVKFLLSSIDIEDPAYLALVKGFGSGPAAIDVSDFDDADLEKICDTRLLLADVYRRRKLEIVLQPCPTIGPVEQPRMGYVVDKVFKRDLARLVAHLIELTKAIGLSNATRVHPEMYVFGHTHSATPPERVRIGLDWYTYIANTGAFQRLATGPWLQKFIADRKLDKTSVLKSISIADLSPCYSFVKVRAGASASTLKQRAWKQANGKWVEAKACN